MLMTEPVTPHKDCTITSSNLSENSTLDTTVQDDSCNGLGRRTANATGINEDENGTSSPNTHTLPSHGPSPPLHCSSSSTSPPSSSVSIRSSTLTSKHIVSQPSYFTTILSSVEFSVSKSTISSSNC
jgi:hypothetical protein